MDTRNEELLVRHDFKYGLAILISNHVLIPYGQSSPSQCIHPHAELANSRAPLWCGTLLMISLAQPGRGRMWQ